MPNCTDVKIHNEDTTPEICRNECAITIEGIIATPNYEEDTITFTIDTITGNQGEGLWYAWEFDEEKFELCDGTDTFSDTLCLKRITEDVEINTEVIVTIEDGVKCEETFIEEFNFDFCYIDYDSFTINREGNIITVTLNGLEGEAPISTVWEYTLTNISLISQSTTTLIVEITGEVTTTFKATVTDNRDCSFEVETEEDTYDICVIGGLDLSFVQDYSNIVLTVEGVEEGEFEFDWNFGENFEACSPLNNSTLCLTLLEDHTSAITVTVTDENGCQVTLTTGELVWEIGCNIELESLSFNSSEIPSDIDIYVFIDRTSLSAGDITTLRNLINTYIPTNINYQNLYIIETYSERWLQYGAFPRQGILTNFLSETTSFPYTVHVNSILPTGISFVADPFNPNRGTLNVSGSFTPSDKAVVLAFVDESANAYHRTNLVSGETSFNATGGSITINNNGNTAQPTPQWMRDYLGFENGGTYYGYGGQMWEAGTNQTYSPTTNSATWDKSKETSFYEGYSQVLGDYTFFKMLLYPIVTSDREQTKNVLLQMLAAIKSDVYTSGETAALEVNSAFTVGEWSSMLALLESVNPYNGVTPPLTDIILSTDKSSPASAVFTEGVLGEDLDDFFSPPQTNIVTFTIVLNNIVAPIYNWIVNEDVFTIVSTNDNEITLEINEGYLGQNLAEIINVSVVDGECEYSLNFQYNLEYEDDIKVNEEVVIIID